MDPHITEWLNLAVRWVHMITGIAWIGASFYFVWLENHLDKSNPKEGLSGDLWAIHGGGIYHLEKYKLAPPTMPETLHWFKWEAYFTFMTGVLLLSVVYYLNAQASLVAPGVEISSVAAIAIGLGTLIGSWVIYDILCDSALGKNPMLLGVVLYILIISAAFGLSQVFNGRAAFIHVGALMGTIMVGNVFNIIMPAQRNLVKAIEEGTEPDPRLPAKGLLRSRHNNYFTLPVLFIMISNHFPSTYGGGFNWAVLGGVAAVSVLARHYFNTRHESQKYAWTIPAAAVGMICLAFITAPKKLTEEQLSQKVSDEQIHSIIQKRCVTCHSAKPSSELFTTAPAGITLDTVSEIKHAAPQIKAQTVDSQVMPLGNLTQMTQEERDKVGIWVEQNKAK